MCGRKTGSYRLISCLHQGLGGAIIQQDTLHLGAEARRPIMHPTESSGIGANFCYMGNTFAAQARAAKGHDVSVHGHRTLLQLDATRAAPWYCNSVPLHQAPSSAGYAFHSATAPSYSDPWAKTYLLHEHNVKGNMLVVCCTGIVFGCVGTAV